MMSSVVQVQWCDTKLRISLLNMPDGTCTHFDLAMATCSVPYYNNTLTMSSFSLEIKDIEVMKISRPLQQWQARDRKNP